MVALPPAVRAPEAPVGLDRRARGVGLALQLALQLRQLRPDERVGRGPRPPRAAVEEVEEPGHPPVRPLVAVAAAAAVGDGPVAAPGEEVAVAAAVGGGSAAADRDGVAVGVGLAGALAVPAGQPRADHAAGGGRGPAGAAVEQVLEHLCGPVPGRRLVIMGGVLDLPP